jgi:hypothetical protein
MTHDELVTHYEERARGQRTITVELAVPIKVNGAEKTEITVRRPTVGDIRRAHASRKDPIDQELWLVAHLCDLAPGDIDQVDKADYDLLEAVIAGFRKQRVAR